MRDYANKESFLKPEKPIYRKPRVNQSPHRSRKFLRVSLKIFSCGFFLGTLIILGYLGWQMIENLPYFAIKEVVLEGGKHIQAQELANQAGITPRQNLLTFDLREARRRILQNPWVEGATVRRRFPDTVVMLVKEREPAGIVEVANSGQRFLISADGVVLEEVDKGKTQELPVIMGISRQQAKPGQILPYEHLGLSLTLINKINFNRPAYLGRIKEAHIRPDGSLILISSALGAPLLVKAENFPAQWPLFLQFLEERPNKRALYEYIDLRFSGKIVTKIYQGRALGPRLRAEA